MRAHLIPLNAEYPPIQIIRDVTLVGRQEDLCDIFLPDVSVSKIHCLIVRTDGLLFIRDLGSTNGTKVNGQRVTRAALRRSEGKRMVRTTPRSPKATDFRLST